MAREQPKRERGPIVVLDQKMLDFIAAQRSAIMVTTRKDGSSHTARITAGVVDGKIWVTGTQTRVRTKHLRANPKASLAVFESSGTGRWLGIEAVVTIHEGPDAPQQCLALRRAAGQEPEDVDAFLRQMVEQERLVYEFEPTRAYGRYE